MEALNTCHGCYRLSSVIHRLRRAGHNIITEKQFNKGGGDYARYIMVRNSKMFFTHTKPNIGL